MLVSIMDKLKGEKKINFKLDIIHLENWRAFNKLYNLGLLIMILVISFNNMLKLGIIMLVIYIMISIFDNYIYNSRVKEITNKYLKVVSK